MESRYTWPAITTPATWPGSITSAGGPLKVAGLRFGLPGATNFPVLYKCKSTREVNEVNEVNGFGNNGELPTREKTTTGGTSGLIAWGDRNYDIDEFRSLVLKKPGDIMEESRDGTR